MLVVERDQSGRDMLSASLELQGYTLHFAGSGEEACDILSVHEVDLVIMGLRLPAMSGPTLFHIIISRWPQLRLRVLVLAGEPEVELHDSWLRLYRLPIVTKPIETSQIASLVVDMTAEEPREVNGEF